MKTYDGAKEGSCAWMAKKFVRHVEDAFQDGERLDESDIDMWYEGFQKCFDYPKPPLKVYWEADWTGDEVKHPDGFTPSNSLKGKKWQVTAVEIK